MKNSFILCSLVFLVVNASLAQTNSFPSSGKVGIGTANPMNALEVSGGQYTNRISQTGATYIEILQRTWSGGGGILFSAYGAEEFVNGDLPTAGNTKNKFGAAILGNTNHGPGMIYFGGNGGVMNFYIGPASPGADTDVVWGKPVLNLNRTGNVGIGVVNPSAKLAVDGMIKTKEVNVSVTGWADHVFKADYKLFSLSELEVFIRKNGHLPSVPTEKDVLKTGVNLSEMNMKLLEKIEELTLHTISQESSIKEQREQINELIKRIDKLENKN